MTAHQARVHHLQKQLKPHQALLLSTPMDVVYFSDFGYLVPAEREAFFVVTQQKSFLIKAFFSPAPAEIFFQVLNGSGPSAVAAHLRKIRDEEKIDEIFIDKSSLFLEEYESILEKLGEPGSRPGEKCRVQPLDRDWIWALRMKKEPEEIKKIQTAVEIAEQSFQAVRDSGQVKEGITEYELSRIMEDELRKNGASHPAFPTIVAFGAHGAEPHYQPQDVLLKKETPILMDFGAKYQGYNSDMTRSFWFGDRPDPEFLKIEKVVQTAYSETVSFLEQWLTESGKNKRREISAKNVDEVARTVITQSGYEKQFIHTTGHGIGLDIHEPPSLNWNNPTVLQPSMVITVEPGIYLDGKFGYRHENTVILKEK